MFGGVCRMGETSRSSPNILVTGTPGVGKSTLCEELAEKTGFQWIDVGKFAKENDCLTEYDETYQCPVLNDELVVDEMENLMESGGKIVDYHGCDFFPKRWFDIVFVLRADTKPLYDRLSNRGYTGKKLSDNVECEIFQTILEEAYNSYDKEIVHELKSNNPDDVDRNVELISTWIEQWTTQHSNGV